MPFSNSHTDLKDRTKQFALAIIELTKNLNQNLAEREIAKQLIRSGMSVGANTRSAFRGRSSKEYKAKLGVVIEEADECTYWMDLLTASKANIDPDLVGQLQVEANELLSIFISLVKKGD
ncbi:MAG: four helix bundle protein [Vicingaceae bacterium]